MAQEVLVVHGSKELMKSFRDMPKEVGRDSRAILRGAGEAVRSTAAALWSPVDPGSAAGFKVRVRQTGVAVEQSRRRTTGLHPEFGGKQMTVALIPARSRHSDEVVRAYEQMLDRVASHEGF